VSGGTVAAMTAEPLAGHEARAAAAGIDVERVTAWLTGHVAGTVPPFRFQVIAGGHSNLTYRVDDAAGRALVLRRPPLAHVLASAHDMGREHRIISSLRDTAVPVPAPLGYCPDAEVIGAPFYVMDFVAGHVVRDAAIAEAALSPAGRGRASRSVADTLAALHAVDIEAVGLADLARQEGYIARQLKRWYGQWEHQRTRDLPLVDEVHAALAERIPEQGAATIVHGDYRLDNAIVSDDGDIVAVLDWEICTLGDPLADVGLLHVYWTGPGDDVSAWGGRSTTAPGFWDRQQVIDRYGEVSGRDLSQLGFYVAFGYWKLACILEGVYARYVGGALGDRDPAELAPFAAQVDAAATMAAQHLDTSTSRTAPGRPDDG
jgi:aminoglycoside phosphotransferase (APT) family kinase protein